MPTRIAPRARLRRIVSGTGIPIIARTNAVPLNSTARLAVAPVRVIESISERPPFRSSRYRLTMKRA